jgi:hypothetical protein
MGSVSSTWPRWHYLMHSPVLLAEYRKVNTEIWGSQVAGIVNTPELQVVDTRELQVKTYAGVTGALVSHTRELQVKTIRRSYRSIPSIIRFATISRVTSIFIDAGVTGKGDTPELQAAFGDVRRSYR